MSEKRSAARVRSFLKGRILFNNRMSSMDCLIRNISGTGAKLEIGVSATIPDVFELQIPQRGDTLRAHLMWRRGEEVGVTFSEAQAPRDPAQDVMVRLKRLEAENAHLRQLLAERQAWGGPGPEDAAGSGL